MTDLHEKESKEDPFSFANDPVADATCQDDEEDDFGDFTSGSTGVPIEAKSFADAIQDNAVKQGETTIEDDLFGGFESSAPPSTHIERLVASEQPVSSTEAEKNIGDIVGVPNPGPYDDFGSFEAAESPGSDNSAIEVSVAADDKQGAMESKIKPDGILMTGPESGDYNSVEGTNGKRISKDKELLRQDTGDAEETGSSENAIDPVITQSEKDILGEPSLDFKEAPASHASEQDIGTPIANFSSFGSALQSDPSSEANGPSPEGKNEEVHPFGALGEADFKASSAEQEDDRGSGYIGETSDALESNSVDGKDFGGLTNRADSKESGGGSVASEQQSAKDDDIDDDFGEFGCAEVAEVCSEDNDFGDFEDTQPAASTGEVPHKDFGRADLEVINDATAGEIGTSQQVIDANNEDDFGDFRSTDKTASDEGENDAKEGQRHHNELAEEDFGEFGTATPSEKPDEVEVANDAKAGELGTPQQEIDANDEDDFDDFGNTQAEHNTAIEEGENDAKEGQRRHDELAEEDFGEFDTATPSEKPDEDAVDHAPEPNDNDDDFGDFRDFEGADENNAIGSVNEEVSEDDFGEFDEAVISGKSNEHVSADRQIIQDDNDDDFGDFGSAEPISKVEASATEGDASGDEFGDFSSFNETEPDHAATSGPVSSPQTLGLDGNDKALLDRAKNTFQRLFAPHSASVEVESEDDNDTNDTKSSVKELLVS